MPRPLKLLLGAATGLLLVLSGYVLVRIFGTVIDVTNRGGSVPSNWLRSTFEDLATVVITSLGLLVALLAVYLWHLLVHRAQRSAEGHVLLWVVAFLLLPMVAMPIYWLTQVWPQRSAGPGQPRTA